MVAKKWEIIEETPMESGRVMCKVLVGTSNRENVYEYFYRDVLEKIVDGTYQYNVWAKSKPVTCVYYNDMLIPHNASVLRIKEECEKEVMTIPVRLFLKALPHKEAEPNEYAISSILDHKYNAEFIRLTIKEIFANAKEAS